MNNNPHLATSRLEYLDRKNLYESIKPELVDRYLGEFVAFEDGRVLDHDPNERNLIERVYRDYGYRDSRLLHLMEANHLQPADLIGVFGSQDLVVEVMDGRRSIDKTHAEKLSDRFNLPPSLFLEK